MTTMDRPHVAVRRARADDLPAIVRLLSQLSLPGESRDPAPTPAHLEAFAAIDADPRQTLFVAESDAGVVGTFVFLWFPNLSYRGRSIAQVESVVVDEASRGRGIGEAMMGHAVAEARARGCVRLQLTTNVARADAKRFYERLGFRHTHSGMKLSL